jgi:chemotaxis protein CheD
MNHFLLPSTTQGSSLKFGLYSVESMLNEMYKLGSKKQNIIAKIAGGGHIQTTNNNRIGDKNVDFAINFCNNEGFEIVSKHTRGTHGRVVLLTKEFQTFIRIVKNRAIEAEIGANEKILYTSPTPIDSDVVTLF